MPIAPAPLAVLMLAAALAVAGARLGWVLMTLNINVPAFTTQVRKLLMAGNPQRAAKLCAVVPAAPVAVGIGAMLAAAESPGDEAERRQRVGAIWLQGVLTLRGTLRRFAVATKVSLGLTGAALIMSVLGGSGLHPLLLMPALATAAVCGVTEFKVRAMETEILDAWEQIVDALSPGTRQQMIAGYEAGRPAEQQDPPVS